MREQSKTTPVAVGDTQLKGRVRRADHDNVCGLGCGCETEVR